MFENEQYPQYFEQILAHFRVFSIDRSEIIISLLVSSLWKTPCETRQNFGGGEGLFFTLIL